MRPDEPSGSHAAFEVNNRRQAWLRFSRDWAVRCLPAACFFIPVVFFARRVQTLMGDTDEGVNLMKALLVAKGYKIYGQIWSDQPPVFTFLLAAQLRAFGPTLENGRLLVLLLAALLLWSLYQTVRRLEGEVSAVAAVVFVVASHRFIELSQAVMIGLPAIALGMVAFWMTVEFRLARSARARGAWLVGSALMTALSVQTKFFTLTMIPALLVLITIPLPPHLSQPIRQATLPVRTKVLIPWAICFIIGFGVVAGMTFESWRQLVTPHLLEESLIKGRYGFGDLLSDTIDGAPYLVPLAVLGLGTNLYRRRWDAVVPAVWLTIASAVLFYHEPLRTHYVPLIGIPLCWLASFGIEATVWAAMLFLRGLMPAQSVGKATYRMLSAKSIAGAAAVIIMLVGALAPIAAQSILRIRYEIHPPPTAGVLSQLDDQAVVERLRIYKEQTHWVFSDLLIYPFCAGLAAPPELAVITEKRIATGFLSDDYLAQTLQRYRPEQILIGRFTYGPMAMDFINTNYVRIWQAPGNLNQYVLRQISNRPNPPGI
jgi:4-amino-4-deoxy-L-arabinose transferase-like glycosyltransferase